MVQMSMTSTGIGATLFAVGAAQLPAGLSAEPAARRANDRAHARCAGSQRRRKSASRRQRRRCRFQQATRARSWRPKRSKPAGRTDAGAQCSLLRACSSSMIDSFRSSHWARRAKCRPKCSTRSSRRFDSYSSGSQRCWASGDSPCALLPASLSRRAVRSVSDGVRRRAPSRTRPSSRCVHARWRCGRPRALSLLVFAQS